MEDEEFESIFNTEEDVSNLNAENSKEQVARSYGINMGDHTIMVHADGSIWEDTGCDWDEDSAFSCISEYLDDFGINTEYLKKLAKALNIKFPHNIGFDKLSLKVSNKLESIVDELNK